MRVYNRALSASEVQQLYGLGAGAHVNTSSANLQRGSTVANGLVGYWTFDGGDISGTTILDLSGNGNDGTDNAATPTIGKLGQALKFDGSSGYADVPYSASLDVGVYSTSVWFKTTVGSCQYITDWNGSTIDKFRLFTGDCTPSYTTNSGATNELTAEIYSTGGSHWTDVTSSVSVNDGKWHHAVTVMDGTYLTLYIDGTLAAGPTAVQAGSITGESDINLFFGVEGSRVVPT